MVFTCLFYSSRNGARRRRRVQSPRAGGPVSLRPSGRPSRRLVPLLRRVRAAAACAEIKSVSGRSTASAPRHRRKFPHGFKPFGGESCPSSRAVPLPASTGFPGPTHSAAARG